MTPASRPVMRAPSSAVPSKTGDAGRPRSGPSTPDADAATTTSATTATPAVMSHVRGAIWRASSRRRAGPSRNRTPAPTSTTAASARTVRRRASATSARAIDPTASCGLEKNCR